MQEKKFDPTKPVILSPGPTSEAGKAISSRNATRHGCCALDTLVLLTENVADLKSLEESWYRSYQPKDTTEIHLLDQLISADWLLQRSVRTLAEVEKEIFTEQPNPRQWTEEDHKTISRFQRYRSANQNAFNKCRRVVEDHFKTRSASQLKEEKLVLHRERHAIYKQKNKPAPSFDETVALMRQKAIALGFVPPDMKK